MIKTYKKRMPKIQAIKFEDTPKNIEEINNFLSNSGVEEIKVDYSDKSKPVLKFKIDKNTIRVPKGDYIAKNKDYIFSCSDGNFNKNYEEVKQWENILKNY